MSTSNGIILYREHYVAVVRPSSGGFLFVDSYPSFKFTFFKELSEIVCAIADLVDDDSYSIHCVHAKSRISQQMQQNIASKNQVTSDYRNPTKVPAETDTCSCKSSFSESESEEEVSESE